MSALTLRQSSIDAGGSENPESKFYEYDFNTPAQARKALEPLGGTFPVVESIEHRRCTLIDRQQKVIVAIPWQEGDVLPGWYLHKKTWKRAVHVASDQRPNAEQLSETDQQVRFKTRGETGSRIGTGWAIKDDDGTWVHKQSYGEVYCVLLAHGIKDPTLTIGHAVKSPWVVECTPFMPQESGRTWNLDAPQHRYAPQPGPHPKWDMIYDHCGNELTPAVQASEWAKRHGITTGADYLRHWSAIVLRHPERKLPYLFFYGEQNSGKSIYHESLSLLMTKGVASADRALGNTEHNGELEGAVLAFIEERDIAQYPGAYAKIKTWVTGLTLAVRKMRTGQYEVPNYLHFVQTSNDKAALPIEFGDTRIVACYVPPLANEIPKTLLLPLLREEAPAFMATLMGLKLPTPEGRLGLQPIDTDSKERLIEESVSDYVRAIVDYMWGRKAIELTAKELAEAIGEGSHDIRKVRKALDRESAYLRSHGITFAFPQDRGSKGKTVILTNAVAESAAPSEPPAVDAFTAQIQALCAEGWQGTACELRDRLSIEDKPYKLANRVKALRVHPCEAVNACFLP